MSELIFVIARIVLWEDNCATAMRIFIFSI
jgi:hypothetical protein